MEEYSKQLVLQLHLLVAAILIATAKAQPINCQRSCGSVSIPYPFGMTQECSLDPSFLVTCNKTKTSSVPFLNINNQSLGVLNMSLEGELHVSLPAAKECYDNKTDRYVNETEWEFDLTPFHLSPKRNKLVAVGVNTLGVVVLQSESNNDVSNSSIPLACVSLSWSSPSDVTNGSCYGVGCCETGIKQGVSRFNYLSLVNFLNNTEQLLGRYKCGYAFLVEDGGYSFSSTHVYELHSTHFPVVLDWAVGNRTCQEAEKSDSTSACKSRNSECHDAKVVPGYRCKCSPGFQGNPYLPLGCEDVDECKESNDCVAGAKCHNTAGSYICSCPNGFQGDGKNNGTRCNPKSDNDNNKGFTALITALSVSVGVIVLLGASFYMYWVSKKRKLIKLKETFFQQNGGLLLQQQIARHKGSTDMAKMIFSVEELQEATKNFSEDTILGKGGQGTVYRGVLIDNRIVAIKKSKISDPDQIEQFINEVIVLSQINHRNVVKLLGCCLETEAPMLVYEFVPNGTLYEHLHGQNQSLKLTWETRLRVATEAAGALAYLHSATSEPIIHRDVKTTNILLDQNLTTKVSDFGASKIVPLDQTQVTTLVQGTLGYLDPEYLHTSQLTEKSDVYSFGVVLAELLTGKKALSFNNQDSIRNINLAMYFVSSIKEGRLLDIVDNNIAAEANVEHLMEFANVAKGCLNVKGEERPTMKEVSMKLERLRVGEMHQQRSVKLSSEEIKYDASGSGISYGFDSLNQISMSLNGAR